jgi:hypothetical protein
VAFFCLLTIGSLSWWHDTPCCTEYFINKSSTKSILNFRWWIVHPTFCVWKTIDFKPWLSVVFQTMSCTIYPFFFCPLAALTTADPFFFFTTYEHVCSVCCNQHVLFNHNMVVQITHCMQAPYKTHIYCLLADRLKCHVYLLLAGVFRA